MHLTAYNLVEAIARLPRNRAYCYINPRTKGQIVITNVELPEGPIVIKRYDPSRGEVSQKAKEESISTQMIWRTANAIRPDQPFLIDRVLGASYNTRSVLEALLAYTPEFYYAYPGRVNNSDKQNKIKHGHKHLIWKPTLPHELGVLTQTNSNLVISEVSNLDVFYDTIDMTWENHFPGMTVDDAKRLIQIRMAIIFVGLKIGYRTLVPDIVKNVRYGDKTIQEYAGVIALDSHRELANILNKVLETTTCLDNFWIDEKNNISKVFEIVNSENLIFGLNRVRTMQQLLAANKCDFVVVACDEDRDKIFKHASLPQFRQVKFSFFSFSAVEELFSLCQRRQVQGVNGDFINSFFEPVM